ncbi:MAG: hypothetical protein MUF18_06515 [Fimbriiglobus sp.]|jgi:hypothetical protein|nr:hypothetical protein [Fimbriiglobus sp.]
MKNILFIALVSLVLFGVSAGLSMWLQMNSAKSADTAHADDKKKKGADDHGDHKDTKDTKDKSHGDDHKADAKEKEKPAEPKAAAKDADRVEYRRLQMEVVAADMSGQMQEYDKLLKRVGAEMKLLEAQQNQIDTKVAEIKQVEDRTAKTAADIKKGQLEMEDAERANLARIAAFADQMPAETTAGIIQQLTDSGKTDTAVKVLAGMKERTAAKVIAAITDPTVPPLLFERMQKLKQSPVGQQPQ